MSENKKITSRNRLKEYFSTGKYPTGEQFGELIDSLGHRGEEALDGAQYFNVSQLHGDYGIENVATAVAALVEYLGKNTTVEVNPGAIVAFCGHENGSINLREYYWTGRSPLNNPENWMEMTTPRAQAAKDGDTGHFVYSIDDPESRASVLNAPDTFVKQTQGHLMMQKGIWNPQGTELFYTRDAIPGATYGADGVMTKEVFGRLGTNSTIREGSAATESVPIIYPNWADGGARTFTLGKATSARAGVMTAADKMKLDSLPSGVVLDLGVVGSSLDAFAAAAAAEVVSDPRIRAIVWRTSDSSDDGGRGSGGTIFQERWGNWYVTQWLMFDGTASLCRVRRITTGGNYQCGAWQTLVLPTMLGFNASTGAIMWGGANDSQATRQAVVIPPASASGSGLMTAADKTKLDSVTDSLLERLKNCGVYGRTGELRYAVNGIFNLPLWVENPNEGLGELITAYEERLLLATQGVKAALTSSDGPELTATELNYCADNGIMLHDEATGGFVQVTRGTADSTGVQFNFLEISADSSGRPLLRMATIASTLRSGADPDTATSDDIRYKVSCSRSERICCGSELDALEARVAALEGGLA